MDRESWTLPHSRPQVSSSAVMRNYGHRRWRWETSNPCWPRLCWGALGLFGGFFRETSPLSPVPLDFWGVHVHAGERHRNRKSPACVGQGLVSELMAHHGPRRSFGQGGLVPKSQRETRWSRCPTTQHTNADARRADVEDVGSRDAVWRVFSRLSQMEWWIYL